MPITISGTIPKKAVELTSDQPPAEAVAAFRQQYPDAVVEFVGDQYVRGVCHKCNGLVLENDKNYRYDHDDERYTCTTCNEEQS